MANNGILASKGVRTMAKITNSRTRKYEYDNNYVKEHFDRIEIKVPKGYRDKLKEAAKAEGVTVSEYIRSKLDI